MSQPAKLGKYPIAGLLGKGAMGVVYKAFDPVIRRAVAIKTIHKQLIGEELSGSSTAMRFKNEARAVGRMSHPNIVAIYEYGEDADTAYIAMEYVEGRTLSQILSVSRQPPECDVLMLMDQLLAALECAHSQGVWHRDIKPANILVTHDGRVKVTDFGIARIESVNLTQVSSTIGTPGYMAPEQYTGRDVDHRVDIFAAGVLLYSMLVGHPPFAGTAETVMYQVVNDDPPPPSRTEGSTRPEFYDAIVARALAKEPKDRYQSVKEFRDALAKRDLSQEPDAFETTVLIVYSPPPAATFTSPGALDAAPSAHGSLPSSGGTPVTGWDAATLLEVERALAPFVGPMAKVLVRQAAKAHLHPDELRSSLCAHLANDPDRKRFTAKFNAATGSTHISGSSTAPGGLASTPLPSNPGAASVPLSPEVLAHAMRVLATRMGPIATVVVKKCAVGIASEDQLHQMLTLQVPEDEQDSLLKALRKGR